MSADGSGAERVSPEDAGEEVATAEGVPSPPAAPLGIRYFGRTDVGLIREHNEDNFLVADLTSGRRGLPDGHVEEVALGPHGMLFAVCDGMGGAAAGEVASQMAVDTLYDLLTAAGVPRDRDDFARIVVRAIEEAGSRIFGAAKMDRSRRGMGTTATVAAMVDRVLFVGQVGDSRAYVLRAGKMGLVTKDQSLVNQLIEAGQLSEEEAEAFEHSNIILQALGTTEVVNVDLTFLELREGDRLLLCSDGLSGLVHGEVIRETLATIPDLAECTEKLVEMANAAGGHDNITVVVADFAGGDLAPADGVDPLYQQYPLPAAADAPPPTSAGAEWTMKAGGSKPGADVKRNLPSTADGAASGTHAPGAGSGMLRAALVLALLAGVAVLLWPDRAVQRVPADPPAKTVATVDRPPRRVEVPGIVRVRTDVEGELFVDGRARGTLSPAGENRFELVPGAYRFEVRREGAVVASANHTVRAGEEAELALEMPAGRVEVDSDPPSSVAELPSTSRSRAPEAIKRTDPPPTDAAEKPPVAPPSPAAAGSSPETPPRASEPEPSRATGPASTSLPPNPF